LHIFSNIALQPPQPMNQQRSNIHKARQRDPIVDVFMSDNTSRHYSLTVPTSKNWADFIEKIRARFELSSTSTLMLYQYSLSGQHQSDEPIDVSQLHRYDIDGSDMSKIRHKYVFCVTQECASASDDDDDDEDKNEAEEEEAEAEAVASMNILEDVNERSFGLDLDLFDRFECARKKTQTAQRRDNHLHYHSYSVLQSLPFHLKTEWNNLKTQTLTVQHTDEKYTIMHDAEKRFSLRTRRLIWPRNLQKLNINHAFEYKLSDMAQSWKWAIVIIHGGKFAAAIYHGADMVAHKTLSRYVTRKKQGKRQMNHLSTSGVRAGSAGGFKRACNEQKLLLEIRQILTEWMDALHSECHKIFLHCPGIHNQQTVYGSHEEQSFLYPTSTGVLNEQLSRQRLNGLKHKQNGNAYRLYKKDERILQIPIATHSVTLREVQRVHYWLSTCWLTMLNQT